MAGSERGGAAAKVPANVVASVVAATSERVRGGSGESGGRQAGLQVRANSFFILQESPLNYASNLLSLLRESGPPVMMHRFGHAMSDHGSGLVWFPLAQHK